MINLLSSVRNIKLMIFLFSLCLLTPTIIFAESKTPKNTKVLVVYYSRDGHTKRVAEQLAKRFNADIEGLIDQKKRTGLFSIISDGKDASTHALTSINPLKNNLTDYDIILIGTPSWFSNVTPAIRTFVTKYKLSGKTIGVFATTNLTGVETALKQLTDLILQGENKEVPSLPLRHKDLTEKILSKKIEEFYTRVMKQANQEQPVPAIP